MNALLLPLCLLILQLPFVIGTSFALMTVVLVPFWLSIGVYALAVSQRTLSARSESPAPRSSSHMLLFGLFCSITLISFFRAALSSTVSAPESLQQALFAGTIALFGLVAFRGSRDYVRGADYLLWSLGIYLLANALLHFAGWRSATNDDVSAGIGARMLSSIGVFTDRTIFPFAVGINSFGAVAGLTIAGGLAGTATNRSSAQRTLAATVAALGLYIVLRTDSRASLASALIAGISVGLAPMRLLRTARWGVPIIPALPLALLAVAVFLATLLGSTSLVRNQEEVYSLGNRAFVWAAIGLELRDFSPQHLVGFGFYGQTQSSVVQRFGDVVGAGYDTSRLTAHNMLLQSVMDLGYLGAAVTLALFWLALSRSAYIPSTQRKVVVAMFLYLLLVGTTESTPTPYYRECFAIFLLLSAYVLVCGRRAQEEPPPEPRPRSLSFRPAEPKA